MNSRLTIEQLKFNIITFWKYKFRVFFDMFSVIVLPMILNYILSKAIISSQNISLNYNLLSYIVISNFILCIVLSDVEFSISSDIKNGKFMYRLLAPISIPKQYFISDLTKKFVRLITFLLPLLLINAVLNKNKIMNFSTSYKLLWFLAIALILGFLISFLIGILSFFLVEIWGINSIKNLAITIFTGAVIPLDIFPEAVKKVMEYLPFPYLSYYPTLAASGGIKDINRSVLCGLIWIVLFIIIDVLVWKKGIKKYEGVSE